jgi:membrane fusion protein, multidrug efflux system
MRTGKKFELRLIHFVGIGIVAVAGIGVFQLWRSQGSDLDQARSARAQTVALGPRVQVIAVSQGPKERAITLLADVRPFATATLYGKVSGYLKSVHVDKGDAVKAGQVIAEVESVETDHQYQAAVADLENKRRVAGRSRELLTRGNVAPQAAETAETNERVAQSVVKQLETMRSYEILRAPFAGIVTARYADPGALLQNAAASQSNSLPVVTISDISKLRVAVYVTQQDVPFVHLGDVAEVFDAANPDRRVKAKVSRTSGSLDPLTRTLLVEVDVDNADYFMVPGSFAYVTLRAPVRSYVQIPISGLVIRGAEQFVGILTGGSKIQFRRVKVANTEGNLINLADGLTVGDRIAINIPDEVTEGSRVQPIASSGR